jgi:CBS domain-containing protein
VLKTYYNNRDIAQRPPMTANTDPNFAPSADRIDPFISKIPPFSFLPDDEFEKIEKELTSVTHPKGTLLFIQGSTVVKQLHIIRKGAVERYYEEGGKKILRGMLGEGDTYGGISMLVNDGISVRTVFVCEDTEFYTLEKARFLELCKTYAAFSEYFTDAFGKHMIDRSYAAILKNNNLGDESPQLFNMPIKTVCRLNPLSCRLDTSIQDAAGAMTTHKCSSIFVRKPEGNYAGVVTDNDFRKKVVAQGYDIHRPVSDIMSVPLHTIEIDALVSEALMEMMDTNLKHLAVTDPDGKIVGVVTNSDILSAQELSPFFIIREISSANTIEDIIQVQERVPRLIHNMINSGAKSKVATKLIAKISDEITHKMILLALQQLGPAPAEFAFMTLGSEGRMEQTLKTDQDNAIIFADVPDGDYAAVTRYFHGLGEQVCEWLDQAGYAFCKGDIMARNPKWCQPLSQWKSCFKSWIRISSQQDLLDAAIFFDFRGAYGNMDLVDELRLYLFEMLKGWSRFFRDMTINALRFKPPIGFFRNFVLESKGQHRNKFDLKKAMTPIVDFARIYALYHNISETNTQERLYHLFLKKVLDENEYNELDQAYNYLMQQRLLCQINSLTKHRKPENHINPKKLSRIEQTSLKEIFKRIEGIQNRMDLNFTGGIR